MLPLITCVRDTLSTLAADHIQTRYSLHLKVLQSVSTLLDILYVTELSSKNHISFYDVDMRREVLRTYEAIHERA